MEEVALGAVDSVILDCPQQIHIDCIRAHLSDFVAF